MQRALRSIAFAGLLAFGPPSARADAPAGLDVRVPATAAVAGAALAAWAGLALAQPELAPTTCRWCQPPGPDRAIREALRWHDPGAAGRASDILVVGLPGALVAADLAMAGGDLRRAGEDVLVAAEAMAVSGLATEVLKDVVGRRRPASWAAGGRTSPDDDTAMPSGHASSAFAVASAFGTIARLRGYGAWPAVYAGGFALAGAMSYLRLAADRHWASDVLAGAAIGTAAGLGVPLLHRGQGAQARPALAALPLGIAVSF